RNQTSKKATRKSGLFCARSKSQGQAFIDIKRHISESPFIYAVRQQLPFFLRPILNLRQTAEHI
ncbi:hypothetical protein, partial [Pseudomonas sp.]